MIHPLQADNLLIHQIIDSAPAFSDVAVDPLRKSFLAHGVSGTPTIVLVDSQGVIRHRQVGYSAKEGLTADGWNWPERSAGN